MPGRPNSLLNDAAPIGPSSMIESAETMRSGLPRSCSQGCTAPGMRRFETEKPTRPALGFEPRPVAPSSRISPPEPVAAPGNGEIAVGWLCVSTFIRMSMGSSDPAYGPPPGRANQRRPGHPSITAALSRYAESTPCGIARVRIADHAEERLVAAHAVDDPVGVEDLVPAVLGVRLREHHELDVRGIAPERAEGVDEVVDLVVGQREPEPGVRGLERRAALGEQRHGRERLRRGVLEERRGRRGLAQHRLGHPVVERRRGAAPLVVGQAAPCPSR